MRGTTPRPLTRTRTWWRSANTKSAAHPFSSQTDENVFARRIPGAPNETANAVIGKGSAAWRGETVGVGEGRRVSDGAILGKEMGKRMRVKITRKRETHSLTRGYPKCSEKPS